MPPPPPPPPLPPPPPYDCQPQTRANASVVTKAILNSAIHATTTCGANRQLAIGDWKCLISIRCADRRPAHLDSLRSPAGFPLTRFPGPAQHPSVCPARLYERLVLKQTLHGST